jgi:hypothetical protein
MKPIDFEYRPDSDYYPFAANTYEDQIPITLTEAEALYCQLHKVITQYYADHKEAA